MKNTSIKFGVVVVLLLGISGANAQNEFEAWKKQQINDFSDYKSKQDKEFASFLKAHWVEIKGQKSKPLYDKNKIIKPPVAPTLVKKAPPKKVVIVKLPEKKPQEKKPVIPVVVPKLLPVKGERINVHFFGNNLVFPYDKKMIKRIDAKIDKEAISSQWSLLARSDYEPLLTQLDSTKKGLGLNDWAYAVLVHKLAGALYPGRENEQVLFSWFILMKSAYRSRLAYENNRVYLLLPVKQQVYAAQSLQYKNQKYYVLGFDGGKQPKINSVFTYDSEYRGSDRLFDLQLPRMITTGKEDVRRDFVFNYSKKHYQIKTVNNKYIVDFMRTYPQVHWDVYFNSNPVNPTRQQLADQLRPALQGLSETEAVNLLLRFVQTSFKYDTDNRQFGYENPLFLEETLFYPASDCEDRSFLFSWLVKELLGLEVVGLLYPGHMATAVHVNMEVKGDSVRYQGKTYLIADPTYTNADIGMAMPKFQSKKPEFIRISNI